MLLFGLLLCVRHKKFCKINEAEPRLLNSISKASQMKKLRISQIVSIVYKTLRTITLFMHNFVENFIRTLGFVMILSGIM